MLQPNFTQVHEKKKKMMKVVGSYSLTSLWFGGKKEKSLGVYFSTPEQSYLRKKHITQLILKIKAETVGQTVCTVLTALGVRQKTKAQRLITFALAFLYCCSPTSSWYMKQVPEDIVTMSVRLQKRISVSIKMRETVSEWQKWFRQFQQQEENSRGKTATADWQPPSSRDTNKTVAFPNKILIPPFPARCSRREYRAAETQRDFSFW